MATKIKCSLFIGLGGTGIQALLHTKKMFIDNFGKVPPMIGFLGIDTDGVQMSNIFVESRTGEKVTLSASEQYELKVSSPYEYYLNNKPEFEWMPSINADAVRLLDGTGAGCIRSNGRFAFDINSKTIQTTIKAKVAEITNANIAMDEDFELLKNALPEIHMVFSVCGGTGCGSHLSVAYAIQDIDPRYSVTGYAVLPGAFANVVGAPNIKTNAYGAIVDLDYCMHHGRPEIKPFNHKVLGGTYTAQKRPFGFVTFIDNMNARYQNYGDVKSIAEMISLALATSVGDIAVAAGSFYNNFDGKIAAGLLDINDKRAWAAGMGACEIIYDGKELANMYRYKAANHVIDLLLKKPESISDTAYSIANTWIDSAEVHIRENNGQDHVTDYIDKKDAKYPLGTINSKNNPLPEVLANINSNQLKQDDVDKKVASLIARVEKEFKSLMTQHINTEGGVALCQAIVSHIYTEMELCLQEMRQERDELSTKITGLKTGYESASQEVERIAKSIFKRGLDNALSDLYNTVNNYNSIARDIQRHDAAITIYNSIIAMLASCTNDIKAFESKLTQTKESLTVKFASTKRTIQNANSNLFQINLANNDADNIAITPNTISVTAFDESLSSENGIYQLMSASAEVIEAALLKYTNSLNDAITYLNKGVEDVLRLMDSDALNELIKLAVSKADPLFTYNLHGRTQQATLDEFIIVGVENDKTSILKLDGRFDQQLPQVEAGRNRAVDFVSLGMKNKVIIYHLLGVVPVYSLNNIADYKRAYDGTYAADVVAHHIDSKLKLIMDQDGFDIQPKQRYVTNNMIEYWVKGLIYGLIENNEKEGYRVKLKSKGSALNQYWVKLNSNWRNQAFEAFAAYEFDVVNEFDAIIDKRDNEIGSEQVKALIQKAKENYYNGTTEPGQVGQVKLKRATLDGEAYKAIKDLLERELQCLENL